VAAEIPVPLQTIYAELLDRSTAAAFDETFPEPGDFTVKTVKERRYWYFQYRQHDKQKQRYVGPETPELLAQIASHREHRSDERERRVLVSTLVKMAGLPAPSRPIGDVLSALARTGVFRLRAVLVGTLAFQTYGAMLGRRLPTAATKTEDIDIAQFREISIAVGETIRGLLETLRQVDTSFRPTPHLHDPLATTAFMTRGGKLRVEFLVPNRGPESDAPMQLRALGTHGQPFRFLDYLIRDPVPAIVLHGPGIPVLVPAPERYGIHKLILSQRRAASSAKRDKDRDQAAALLDILARERPAELRDAWDEAWQRGKRWRELLVDGLRIIAPRTRDETLRALNRRRRTITGLDIKVDDRSVNYHPPSDSIRAVANVSGEQMPCVIEKSALTRISGETVDPLHDRINAIKSRERAFHEHLRTIQESVAVKYLDGPVEDANLIRIGAEDLIVPSTTAIRQKRDTTK
jgi:hypothetical protein